MTWLDDNGVDYVFHNYKESGIDKKTLKEWLKHFPSDKLINTKGTTFRKLTDEQKESISNKSKAVDLMMEYTSVIKRPVMDLGNGIFLLGWDEAAVSEAIL